MSPHPPQEESAAQRTECPLCGATIPAGARKCMFCGSVVRECEPEPQVAAPKRTSKAHMGSLFLWIPGLATVVVVGCIGRMSPLQNPYPLLVTAAIIVAGISAGMAAVESSRLRMKHAGYYSPLIWLLLVFVLWPVGLPMYLRARARVFEGEAEDPTMSAVVLAAVFTVSVVWVGWSIKAAEASAMREAERQQKEYLHMMRTPPVQATPK